MAIGFILLVLALILAFAGFYLTRSSKEMPKTWPQLRSEILWQYLGIRGLIEDFALRKYNQMKLVKQPGRVVVITGGNRGIGLEIVKQLLNADMTVIMGVRNPKEAQFNVEQGVNINNIVGKIIYEQLDTSSLTSVRRFAATVLKNFPKIDILINNAGVMATPYHITEDNFESQFAINYLGHFLLTHLLLPALKAAGTNSLRSRIVNVSSCVHLLGVINFDDINGRKYYYPPDAYNQSKLAQVLFTRHLQGIFNEDENTYVQVHAVHPGVVDTDLFVHSSTTYVPWFKKLLFKTPEEGSRTILYAAQSPKIEGRGGTYMSNCRLVQMSSEAKNKTLCEKFFEYSCDLVKINNFGAPEQQ